MRTVTKVPLLLIALTTPIAHSGAITGGELLNQTGANRLEAWLGQGNLDFINISNLNVGDTAAQWHSDVRGYENVVSIYDVTYNGINYLIGGYSSIGHDGDSWRSAPNNFLFNLTLNNIGYADPYPQQGRFAQYDSWYYFATFGAGHDLFGGHSILGNGGLAWNGFHNGSISTSYDLGSTGLFNQQGGTIVFTVNGLESFTFEPSALSPVPLPSAAWLFGSALIGFAGWQRKKNERG